MGNSGAVTGLAVCLAAGFLLSAGCTAPAVEKPGPAQVRPMAERGAYSADYVTTTRREGVTQPFLLLRPEHPVASVILFSGGQGDVRISPAGIRRGGNFLVRSRERFAEQALLTAVVDVPSDRSDLSGFRTRRAHALDIKGVIAYLREQAPLPVWLVGTSRGTISAAKIADWLADEGGPDGIVLTSSLFVPGPLGESVDAADPERIRIPLLLVHHKSDRCWATPFSRAAGYVQRMTRAQPRELLPFAGGGPVRGGVCEPFDYHGFPGLEAQVVETIASWIKAHPPRTP
jgi:hypothetical protein